ncbi:hypothetical protein ACFQ07_23855, partial [Actinomadura adrarensis]
MPLDDSVLRLHQEFLRVIAELREVDRRRGELQARREEVVREGIAVHARLLEKGRNRRLQQGRADQPSPPGPGPG